jgi:DNA mismatch repair protein MSH6
MVDDEVVDDEMDPSEKIGRGIRVYWKDDDAWYKGRIGQYESSTKKYLVEYDDGDEEWVDITTEKVEILDTFIMKPRNKKINNNNSKKSSAAASIAAAAKRKRAAAVIDSDDDSEAEGDATATVSKGKASGAAKSKSKAAEDSESEYAASDDEDDANESDAESMDLVESEDDDEEMMSEDDVSDLLVDSDEDDVPAAKGKVSKKKPPATTPAGGGGGAKRKTSSGGPETVTKTPGVALNNGVSITPESGTGTGGKKGLTTATAVVAQPAAGHIPASSSAMRKALDRSPTNTAAPGSLSPGGALVDAAVASSSDASRFVGRDAARFPFLHPEKIKDSAKRRPVDPEYDPTTLYIPPDWFKQQKISEGQRQWWEFKAANWGSVLLFKMGKFYELFEMDAHIGAECLGLSYMKGDQPHCGFPEAGYAAMAERLARAGHRVVVIEQTETPDALAKRNEERKKKGLKKDMVVRREKVAVLTRGTLTDAEMMGAVPDAQYLMAITEVSLPAAVGGENGGGEIGGGANGESLENRNREKVWIGAAAVDVATGQLLVGQWRDDELRSQLRAALTALSPVEVVLPRGTSLSGPSRRVVLGVLRSPLVNELPPGDDDGHFWSPEETWNRLLEKKEIDGSGDAFKYFPTGSLPEILSTMESERDTYTAATAALGGCVSFLQKTLLDKRILGAGRVEAMEEAVGINTNAATKESSAPKYMNLDGPALENLEIMENSEGGIVGTLLAALDHCTTPFGRRRLRQWLCRPLCRVSDIVLRQDAVQDLMGPAEEAACTARKALSGVSDLERALARLGATGAGVGSERDHPRVVLYEDVSKKRVHAFVSTLRALEKVQKAVEAFSNCGATSSLLLDLVTPSGANLLDMEPALAEMRAAADWEEAESTGRVVPAAGVDADYDAAEEAVKDSEAALSDYLKDLKAELGSRDVKYASLNKESHVIEVPEDLTVPREWESMQGKKGVKRYMNSELRELVTTREAALDAKEKAQTGILRAILRRFAEKREIWAAAVESVAILDALMSLAVAAACGAGAMSRPKLLSWSEDAAPVFRAQGLRHPAAGVGGSGGAFVPNDVQLGGDSPPFVVLTGPNMGGKSTLMRQVCLAAVAAQIGAWVPAEALELTPTDAVFVRMGARDRIMLGQSTFFVELSETAAALASATRYSLVALDELGRGTATTDGAAIAAAVLDHLAAAVKCRGVFATHYHHISDSHADDPAVAIKHMACAVTPAEDGGDGVDQVTFLYRLSDGACPKSYGVNVARLAGLPDAVVRRAAVVSQQAEDRGIAGLKETPLGAVEAMEVDVAGDKELENLRRKVVEACSTAEVDPERLAAVLVEVKTALSV